MYAIFQSPLVAANGDRCPLHTIIEEFQKFASFICVSVRFEERFDEQG